MRFYIYATLCSTLMLTACGNPDSSGIYVFSNQREVTMVQLVQAPDGKITGRIQSDSINADGKVTEKSASADGAISGDDLVFKPTNAWFGGLQASGNVKGSKLTLAGEGFTLTATRSSLEDFQQKVSALKAVAAEKRNEAATMAADAAQVREQADIQRNLAAQAQQVTDRVADMRSVTSRLSDAINQSPNFARAAAINTAKIARMASTAPTLAFVARGQLGVAANQVAVNTNQIEVQRTQYANNMNGLVADIANDVNQIDRICGKAPARPLVAPCESAKLAAREYKTVYERGRVRFTPYKALVEAEMAKQERLIGQIDN